MAKLILLCGIPGLGKTTYAKDYISQNPNTLHVSRDAIRFGLLPENFTQDNYFSKEDEVFFNFIKEINSGLSRGYDVIADATHISPCGRYKVVSKIPKDIKVVVCVFKNNLQNALDNNEKRKGTKSYVPRAAIKRMYNSFVYPDKLKEKYINEIKFV